MRRTRGLVVLFAAAGLAAASLAPGASAAPAENPTSSYIVVLEPGSTSVRAEATRLAREYGGRVGYVYEYALRGFSITTTEQGAAALARSSRVDYVEKDQVVSVEEQTTPTGLGRIFAAPAGSTGAPAVGSPYNSALDIDGVDDLRVDVDIAVIDTGIDLDHPDLNVVGGVNCLKPPCVPGGDDDHYHGTHVAGTAAALDNGIDVVGVAPGARLWAVKVLNRRGSGTWSGVIAGIDWVTANAGVIEVANMSLGGGKSDSVNQAVAKAVTAGVTMVVAAGNSSADVKDYSPASEPTAITVSALADYDGLPDGLWSGSKCLSDTDDTFAYFSNYGEGVDIIAPGVCITSTNPGGGLRTISGTSMAAPHVAGAAALLRSTGTGQLDAESNLLGVNNLDWNDADDPDGVAGPKEPLLDVHTFAPELIDSPTGGGGSGTGGEADPGTPTFTWSSDGTKGGWLATVHVANASPGSTVAGTWNDGATPNSCKADSDGKCDITRKANKRTPSVTWTWEGGGDPVVVPKPTDTP